MDPKKLGSPAQAQKKETRPELARPKVRYSEDLFEGQKSMLIQHRGETYCLRETKNGKLILTK